MPTPPLSDELALEAWEAYVAHDYKKKPAADSLGISDGGFSNRLKIAKERGFHLSEGARGVIGAAKLAPTEARGGWLHSYDEDGKKIGATYWKAPESALDSQDALDRIRRAFDGLEPVAPSAAPLHADADLLTLYPIADAHVGMMAWGQETGEDYNTRIAHDRIVSWIGRAVASSPESDIGVILSVGDTLHSDDQTNMTPASKHILDADTRQFKTIDVTIRALAASVDLALTKHRQVIVRILPGNHDPHGYMALLFALAERYRNEPRVIVQKIPGEFFLMEFGKCLLAAHHGHRAKADRMVLALADEHAEAWGRTRHRFLWTGHLHHHKSQDIGGVQWEQLRAVTARDAYAASHSYTARAQLQAITYHKTLGEVQRVKIGQPE